MSFLAYWTGSRDDFSSFLVIDLHRGHVKDLTSVVTQTPEWLRTTKVKFFKIYLCDGMSDPG